MRGPSIARQSSSNKDLTFKSLITKRPSLRIYDVTAPLDLRAVRTLPSNYNHKHLTQKAQIVLNSYQITKEPRLISNNLLSEDAHNSASQVLFFICSTKDGDEFRQKCSTFFSFSCSSTFASSMLNRLV